jgi:WD40 repeat protein
VACLLLIVPVRSTRAQVNPPADAILRISTKMHGAGISQIAIDAGDRYLVTASFDNTVRIWSLPDATLMRVLRMPVGNGGFSVFAASISPDGGTVAVGGLVSGAGANNAKSAYLFDRETGALLQRLGGLRGAVTNLAYSKDGRYLAAMLGGSGIRVYDVKAGYTVLPSDSDYSGVTTWADFDKQGQLVTVSSDGYVRLYSAGTFDIPSAKSKFLQGNSPSSAAFSPDGSFVAVSGLAGVDVYSPRGLNLLYSFAYEENSFVSSVTWSADGKYLFAGGYFGKGGSQIRRWTGRVRGPSVNLSIPSNKRITALKALNSDGVLYATTEPAIGVVDPLGKVTPLQGRETFDWGARPEALAIAPDGKTIEIRASRPQRLVRFSMRERGVFLDPPPDRSLNGPLTESPGALVENWRDTGRPAVNGQPIELDREELSQNLAIDPHDQIIVLGTSWWLRAIDFHGKLLWKTPVPSVESVNVSADGRLIVSAHSDGTLRWRRREDGKEILTLLVQNDGQRWAAWTPEGYYDASVGGEELVGWQVDRGPEHAPDFFQAAVFRERFYRPDVIADVLDTLDIWEALKLADKASGRRTESAGLKELLPPVIQILSPTEGSVFTRPDLTLTYHVRSTTAPIKGVRVLIDGRAVLYQSQSQSDCGNDRDCTGTVSISLPKRDVAVTMVGESTSGVSPPADIRLRWSGSQEIQKPNLYLLAVGVSRYLNPLLNVKYAARDAAAFAEAVKKQEAGLYERITTKVILDQDARLDAIKEGLAWLKQNVRPSDVAMIFLSGQSARRYTANYDFLPYDADMAHSDLTSLHDFELEYFLSGVAGKAFLFVDSCYSGGTVSDPKEPNRTGLSLRADVNHLANGLAQNGVVVFTSSTSQQFSYESDVWGHSAFTKALLEGLSGEAAGSSSSRVISVNELATYVNARVEELTAGRQTPSIAKPTAILDTPIAIVR